MKVLLLDNYDSFTYNLLHLVQSAGKNAVIDVIRNDKLAVDEVKKYDKILLSPGPGLPSEAGIMMDIIKKYAAEKPILGVCLGFQGIAEAFGGCLINLDSVMHGVAISTIVIDKEEILFEGMPHRFLSGRYHSWAIDRLTLPDCFKITAVDGKQMIMAISHKQYDVKGVQFHPESILSEHGERIIRNWLGQ